MFLSVPFIWLYRIHLQYTCTHKNTEPNFLFQRQREFPKRRYWEYVYQDLCPDMDSCVGEVERGDVDALTVIARVERVPENRHGLALESSDQSGGNARASGYEN